MKLMLLVIVLSTLASCTTAERKRECKRTCIERAENLDDILDNSCICIDKAMDQ